MRNSLEQCEAHQSDEFGLVVLALGWLLAWGHLGPHLRGGHVKAGGGLLGIGKRVGQGHERSSVVAATKCAFWGELWAVRRRDSACQRLKRGLLCLFGPLMLRDGPGLDLTQRDHATPPRRSLSRWPAGEPLQGYSAGVDHSSSSVTVTVSPTSVTVWDTLPAVRLVGVTTKGEPDTSP